MNLLYIFKAAKKIGMGHMSRALSFGRAAKKNNIECILGCFGKNQEDDLRKMKNFARTFSQAFTIIENFSDLTGLINAHDIQIVLIDFPNSFASEDHDVLVELGRRVKIVTIDDVTQRRLLSDICFYPPLTWLNELDWSGYQGRILSGWQYYIMRPELEEFRQKSSNIDYDFLVTCGGSDSRNLSKNLITLIRQHLPSSKIAVILGPLAERMQIDKDIDTFIDPSEYIELLSRAENVICTYGVTLFELAYLKKRVFYICLDEDHVKSSEMFLSVLNFHRLGLYDNINQAGLSQVINGTASLNSSLYEVNFETPLNSKIFYELEELSYA